MGNNNIDGESLEALVLDSRPWRRDSLSRSQTAEACYTNLVTPEQDHVTM